MTTKLAEWASEHRQITKNSPSDGCGRDAVLLAVERWYDFPEFEGYLGTVGQEGEMQDLNVGWELPWPRLEVPAYQDTQIKEWYIKNAVLLVQKGYFLTVPPRDLHNYTMLVRDADDEPITVMSTLPMEVESNALHAAAARGTVVIMGAGMGLTLYNILKKHETSKVVVVERDPLVIQLLHQAAGIENWEGFEKLTFVNSDAFQFVPEQPVDCLYVDIWDDLGDSDARWQTQQIQSNVKADLVGWWGQEIEFLRWMVGRGFEQPPTLKQYSQWAEEIDLPLIEQDNPHYMRLIQAVSENFASLVGIEENVDDPKPAQGKPVRGTPEGMLARAQAPDGGELVLCERGGKFGILVDGRELMSSEGFDSEKQLALLSCEPLADHKSPSVVIGGLGMGFTLRAALDVLPVDARVTVVEVVPEVVEWNRGPLGPLTDHPLDDARVQVEVADIGAWLEGNSGGFDAILLDVDNGPAAVTLESNRDLYSNDGLARAMRMLNRSGVLAIWSATRVRDFERRLGDAGFQTEIHQIPSTGAIGGQHHIVYLSRA